MTTAKSRKSAPYRGDTFEPEQDQEVALEAEIRSLRSQAGRVAEMAREAESLKEAIQALNALGTAFNRLARLLESQKKLAGGRSEFDRALEEVLAQINREDEEKRKSLQRKALENDRAQSETKLRSSPRSRKKTSPSEAKPAITENNLTAKKGDDYAQ
jgi:hypothetical protein